MAVRVQMAGKTLVGVIRNLCERLPEHLSAARVLPIEALLTEAPRVGGEQLEFWQTLSEYYLCTLGEVFKATFPVWEEPASIRAARKKKADAPFEAAPITLSPAQQIVFDGLEKSLGEGKTCLLEGVTGSGKTEIYLSLARKVMEKGDSVLYLVPEIALSRQLEDRLRTHFGDRLRVFHSKETPARRSRLCWELSHNEEGPLLVLGTRSAVFLPPDRWGLIIVDEEHDASYKQDSPAPRYNGRDSALMLSRILGCPALLGSATPSLESLYNCTHGKMQRFFLGEKYHHAESADIEIIDTLAERRKRGMKGSFSIKLIERIQDTLAEGKQVVILRSRKAYALYLQCQDCGAIPKCKHCNLPLSYHKATDRMACHHCGKSRRMEPVCPACGGTLQMIGAGTERIEEEAITLFPHARVARLDAETASSTVREREIIDAFSRGEADILIGTQMVAKGFDFPGLKMVAVIDADALLGIDDFRADEKALQTLSQLRGRCSRREEKGLFVIQTQQPSHPVYEALKNGNGQIQPTQLEERENFAYPPYTRLVDLIVGDYQIARLNEKAGLLATLLIQEGYDVLGPYETGSGKHAGMFQKTLRLTFPKNKLYTARKKRLGELLERFEREEKYLRHISVNVDSL